MNNQKEIPSTKKIVITGTHLTPAIELIHQLQKDSKTNWEISYIGRYFNSSIEQIPSIESRVIPKIGIKFYPIHCGKIDRKYFPNTIQGFPQTIKGFFEAFKIISKIRPNIIISFGGYVSVPVILAGFIKKIPSITHEQTSTNSLTTKINSLFVKKVALSFNNPKQIKKLPPNKVIVTGNLLRSEIYDQSSPLFKNFELKIKNSPIIYITAGNQGSHTINKIIPEIVNKLPKLIFIHQTGQKDFDKIKKNSQNKKNYFVFDYINLNDIGWILNKSDILIGRSGANTSQEIVALNKKSILIPLPKSQQDEQKLNALWVKKQLEPQTIIISQNNLTSKLLLSSIQKLLKIKPAANKIKSKTNLKLLKLIYEII